MTSSSTWREGWAVLEIMGHRTVAGYVREVELFGTRMCQVEVPEQPAVEASSDGWSPAKPAIPAFTQLFSGASIFSCIPCSEDVARAGAARVRYGSGLALLGPERQLEAPPEVTDSDEYDSDVVDAQVEDGGAP